MGKKHKKDKRDKKQDGKLKHDKQATHGLTAAAGGLAVPEPLRKGGKAVIKWLATPEGRQVLSAGLAAMAAALASNKRVRQEVADTAREAGEKAQHGAAATGALAGLAVDLAAEGVKRLVRGSEERRRARSATASNGSPTGATDSPTAATADEAKTDKAPPLV